MKFIIMFLHKKLSKVFNKTLKDDCLELYHWKPWASLDLRSAMSEVDDPPSLQRGGHLFLLTFYLAEII
jgi:hypothetical protein